MDETQAKWCPKLNKDCMKEKCEFWVELFYDKQKKGRCSVAYMVIVTTELRAAIDKLKNTKKEEQSI